MLTHAWQTLRATFLLPWISQSIGLLVALHTCHVLCAGGAQSTRAELLRLPVEWGEVAGELRVTGLTPELAVDLLAHCCVGGLGPHRVEQRPCNCALNAAL
eukprot:778663-Pyramimonas_sp.AAC.1